MPSPSALRARILEALEADLVGPFHAEPRGEVLPLPPSRWYLTGFLAPLGDRDTHDATAEDELGAGSDEDDEDAGHQEPEPKQRKRFPASLGMSVLIPAATERPEVVCVTVRFADYVAEAREVEGSRRPRTVWRRVPRGPFTVELPLEAKAVEAGVAVPEARGVRVTGRLETAEAPGLPEGTRALAVFVVNERRASEPERGRQDAEFLFQVELEVEHARGLVPRPNRQGEQATDWDDRVADLQFRDRFEWAVGHGVSVVVPDGQSRDVRRVRTTWLPRSEVRGVRTREHLGDLRVETRMEKLGALTDAPSVRAALLPLVEGYGEWLGGQRKVEVDSADRRETRDALVARAEHARSRIRAGIEALASDAALLEAFCLANKAMATSARRRNPERYPEGAEPRWRLFQLAFVVLNVCGIADETHADRENVELIFFPTGGGKTEVYLGVIAFTLVLRRLRGAERPDRGLGVAVLLRYTLRLLTLDQLGRAATLVCALEMLRRDHARLGTERFAVGLWVGRTATANTLEQVRRLILEYKNSASKNAPSPFPLVACPWCNEPLGRDSLALVPSPTKAAGVVVGCTSFRCAFSARNDKDGLPVLFVDEQIYRELPAFLVATVDKFAMLPWRGETGMLFGRVSAREGQRFYGPLDSAPRGATELPDGLRPPELIVQDELHLISGPLGTMVGLYETAIEYLCSRRTESGAVARPKILASTATVRRAREQIRGLFGRREMALFPPPGVDESETWFAEVDRAASGRLYVGVAAQGRAMKAILLRAYITLLAAAQKQYQAHGKADNPADPYMTVAGYFNSLRELGGMRRLVEDEVRARAAKASSRLPLYEHAHPWLADRQIQIEPVELTSREPTGKIKEAKDRLSKPHADPGHVDVLLASNMISVGVDIDRLGLMVVGGQPKTTSEYIQATSRVGRQHPGLVVTCFNAAKPRDRSHYERFAAYHESFYRFVEATSLTPFSGPALERGLAGTLVAMVRLADAGMTPPGEAMAITTHRKLGEEVVAVLAERACRHDDSMDAEESERLREALRARGLGLLDDWEKIVARARSEAAAKRTYSRFDRDKAGGKPLLFMVVDEERPAPHTDEAKFAAPTSMRDVEASVHLWLERRALGGRT
ncbi:MAG: helicase [Myxococcales bacterium]|nr:helicase [Myxococcales bacterium]